jgi:hypothetical protein
MWQPGKRPASVAFGRRPIFLAARIDGLRIIGPRTPGCARGSEQYLKYT